MFQLSKTDNFSPELRREENELDMWNKCEMNIVSIQNTY